MAPKGAQSRQRWFVQDQTQTPTWHLLGKGEHFSDGRAACGLAPPPGGYWWAAATDISGKTDAVCRCARRYRW